jgi:peroxin-12
MTTDAHIDPYKPSLFELLSSTQLSSLLPPSLQYLLTVATHRYPRHLLPILNSFHEIHALLFLGVEHHYLTNYSSSFVENFYSLKRERSIPSAIGSLRLTSEGASSSLRETLKLTRLDIWKNLAVLVGIPYLKRRLDESHEINAPRALLGANYTRMPPNPTLKQRFMHYYRWFLRNIYPSLNAAYYFSMLAFNLGYLFDNSKYNDPFLWLIGTRLRRLSQADFQAFEALENASSSSPLSNLGVTSLLDPRVAVRTILRSLKFLLPTSIFALKFLEWWHASDFAKQLSRKATEGIELPPPVTSGVPSPKANTVSSPEAKEEGEYVPSKPPTSSLSLLPIFVVAAPEKGDDTCPICKDEITTPTACQTGYVYCYTCIHRWLEGEHALQERFMDGEEKREGKWESGKGRCAVTGRRVLGGASGLRRVLV